MKNTLENKAKFFAQYLGQKVFWHPDYESEISILKPIRLDATYHYISEGYCLKLKPISSITDEELIKLSEAFRVKYTATASDDLLKIWGHSETKILNIKKRTGGSILAVHLDKSDVVDFLRYLGFAVEWMGLSIENQIKYGWIKLKEL